MVPEILHADGVHTRSSALLEVGEGDMNFPSLLGGEEKEMPERAGDPGVDRVNDLMPSGISDNVNEGWNPSSYDATLPLAVAG